MSSPVNRVRAAVLGTNTGRVVHDMIARFRPYRPISTRRELWDARYAAHAWDRLHGIDELARYSIIAGYIPFIAQSATILDVGCGEGLLSERLCPGAYERYLGIDMSLVAIGKAKERKLAQESRRDFLVAEIDSFTAEGKFDVIVFNECLYYLPVPAETLRRCERLLAENGSMIVSMVETIETKKVWAQLGEDFRVQDSVAVTNHQGTRWIIKVLRGSK